MVEEEIHGGEVCRKIDLLRKDLKEIENRTDLNNREVWQTIDKIKEDLHQCKLNFATFDSKTCGDFLGIQKDYVNTNKDLEGVKTELNFVRGEQKEFWRRYEDEQKKQNEKFSEIVEKQENNINEKFDIINNTVGNIKIDAAKNSATIAIIIGLVLSVVLKIWLG